MTTSTRIYVAGTRTFEIRLFGTSANDRWSWSIESVIDTSRGGRVVVIRELDNIAAVCQNEALARARDHIDAWLLTNP